MKQGGYTFFSTYQICQRQFYFKYVLRWELDAKNDKMKWGNVLHEALCQLTRAGTGADVVQIYDTLCKEEDLHDVDLINRGMELLHIWIDEYLPIDLKKTWVTLDELMGVQIDDFLFLAKPDRVLFNREQGKVEIFEVKTTQYSVAVIMENLQRTDQTTAYIWAWNKLFPDKKVNSAIPEVLYSRGSVNRVERGTPIYRSDYDLHRFENVIKALIYEIKYKAEQKDPELFHHKVSCTEGSNFGCPYVDICRHKHTRTEPPIGFHLREREIK
jgi:hypothetical protein